MDKVVVASISFNFKRRDISAPFPFLPPPLTIHPTTDHRIITTASTPPSPPDPYKG